MTAASKPYARRRAHVRPSARWMSAIVCASGRQNAQMMFNSKLIAPETGKTPTGLTRRGFPHFGSENPKHVLILGAQIET